MSLNKTDRRVLLEDGSGVEQGTAANPVRTDTTGTTTQPVSATALPLPTGAATESTLANLDGKVTTVDTGNVTIASPLPAGTNNIGDVDVASSALPAGASTEATLAALNATITTLNATIAAMNAKFVDGNDIGDTTINNAAGASAVNIQDGGNSITVDGTVSGGIEQNEDSPHTTGDPGVVILGVRNDAGGTLVSTDGDYSTLQFDGNGNVRVTTQGTPTFETVTHTTVSVTSTSVTALAANADRRYALLQNHSNQDIFIFFGGVAVVDEGILLIANGSMYEINFSNLFTGLISAIKLGGGSSNLLVTEGT